MLRGVSARVGLGGDDPLQEAQQLDREGQHERRVLLGGDRDDGLQQPQLERRRLSDITSAASASFLDAWSSASALMTRARRSRSASAWRDMDASSSRAATRP